MIWQPRILHRMRKALGAVGIGVFPLYGPRFWLNVFRDIRKYAPHHDVLVVLDVGANVGKFSMEAASAFPGAVIHAFEPVEATFKQLQAATRNQPRILCHNVAMGDDDGERFIFCNLESVYNRIAPQSDLSAKMPTTSALQKVQMVRLDSFARANSISGLDLLKIDTEGFEREVLRGAGQMLRNTAFIYCEVGLDCTSAMHVPFEEIITIVSSHKGSDWSRSTTSSTILTPKADLMAIATPCLQIMRQFD